MNFNFCIIIQARTSSKRIPRKVLYKIDNHSILEYVILRLLKKNKFKFIVCTSSLEVDLPICELCSMLKIEVFRGSHLNVASRYYEICKNSKFDAFIRICADSPTIDGSLVHEMTGLWHPELDLLTNKSPRTFPKGQSIEIVNRKTYLKAFECFEINEDFEHVTHYFHRNLDCFRHKNIRNSEDQSKMSLAIDEPADLFRFESFVKQYGPDWVELPFDKILEIYLKDFND